MVAHKFLPNPPSDQDNESPQGHDKFMQANSAVVPVVPETLGQIRYQRHYTVHLLWWLLGCNNGTTARHSVQELHDLPQPLPQSDDGETSRLLRRTWRWMTR